MNKSIFKTAVAVAVTAAAVFCVGCSEKPDEDEGGNSGGGGGKGNDISKYKTEKIGTQTWMAENLDNAISGSVCYDNNSSNCDKYGRLYTWEAAKQACPSGWHLPTDAEWTTLTDYVGGEETAGTKLKSTSGWSSGNGTDEYGFSALPGGVGYGGIFDGAGDYGRWWSATEYDAGDAYYRRMYYSREDVERYDYDEAYQFSVRCVQG